MPLPARNLCDGKVGNEVAGFSVENEWAAGTGGGAKGKLANLKSEKLLLPLAGDDTAADWGTHPRLLFVALHGKLLLETVLDNHGRFPVCHETGGC